MSYQAEQQYTLALMNANRQEKNEGWTINLVQQFPLLQDLQAETFIGSFSWVQSSTKTKWIKKQFAYDIGGGWCTPSDIARDYINVKHDGKRLRCNKVQHSLLVKNRKHTPLFAVPCKMEHGYYVDMVSAYWQILMTGGFDVDYCPNRYLSVRNDVYDFPVPNIKLARNCLVSTCLPATSIAWNPKYGFVVRNKGKISVNLVLWGFAMDVLHGFAWDMIYHANAKYVNTDGYIVADRSLQDAFEVAASWGLTVAIKHEGKVEIRGAGDYDIGYRKSKRPRRLPIAYSYIVPTATTWLQQNVKHFSNRINLDLLSVTALHAELTNLV
jgi:hypothetical protein